MPRKRPLFRSSVELGCLRGDSSRTGPSSVPSVGLVGTSDLNTGGARGIERVGRSLKSFPTSVVCESKIPKRFYVFTFFSLLLNKISCHCYHMNATKRFIEQLLSSRNNGCLSFCKWVCLPTDMYAWGELFKIIFTLKAFSFRLWWPLLGSWPLVKLFYYIF